MDYSFFDSLIDSAIVINSDREVIYCNEPAAALLESSVRRLSKGKKLYDVIQFEDNELFLMPGGTKGESDTYPLSEMNYKLPSGKEGKLQISIQPFEEGEGERRWAIVIRETSLEEVLHAKNQERLRQLEEYSKNLEKMVEERTKELAQANNTLSAIMNSLGQGFLTFNEAGDCSDVYTKACEDILEGIPAGKNIKEVLKVDEKEQDTFKMWKQAVFSEQLPFESLKSLGPQLFSHSENRHVTLDFYPIRGESEVIENIVLVATDKTTEYEANLALEREKKHAQMIIKLVTNKKQFSQFLNNAKDYLESVVKLLRTAEPGKFDHEQAFRILHTLEGEAGTYSVGEIWASSRKAQEVLEPLKQGWESDLSQILPALEKAMQDLQKCFDEFMQGHQELFEMIGIGEDNKVELERESLDEMLQSLSDQGVSGNVIQMVSDALFKESFTGNFRHFNDVIKLVAEKQGKQVSPIDFKGDVKVYAEKYKNLVSAFVHAFRNAVDHGIEPPEEREMMGKPATGSISVDFQRVEKEDGAWIHILVQDDGKGIDPQIIRSKIQDHIDSPQIERMSDSDVIQYVFDPGLSSREEVGEFSGRGIGLNAVKDEAEKLGGRAWVESEVGRGTKLQVVIPETSSELTMKASA